MPGVRKAGGYQGYSSGSRPKTELTARRARRAAKKVVGMFAAVARAEMQAVRA